MIFFLNLIKDCNQQCINRTIEQTFQGEINKHWVVKVTAVEYVPIRAYNIPTE